MTQPGEAKSSRILDPLERSSEIVLGLIMALTFTCSVSVASSTLDVRTMLFSALGCNIAWGLIDGAMYILSQLVTRQRQRNFAITIADASPPEARRMILGRLPDGLEPHMSADELDRLAKRIRALPPPSQTLLPHRDDLRRRCRHFLARVLVHAARRTALSHIRQCLHSPSLFECNCRRITLRGWSPTGPLYGMAFAVCCRFRCSFV